jgi:hypothetical protein
MEVQVRDGFSGVASIVDHDSKATFRDPGFGGDFRHGAEHAAEQGGVSFAIGFGEARNAALRNEEEMHGGLRLDIAKGQKIVRFMDDIGWDLAGSDFFE